jgi:hypothetical protein
MRSVPPLLTGLACGLRLKLQEGYTAEDFRGDVLAGLVVGVVALPLQDVGLLEELLDEIAVGTRLIAYNGSGTRVPGSFDLIGKHGDLPCELCIWQKTRPTSGGLWHQEHA